MIHLKSISWVQFYYFLNPVYHLFLPLSITTTLSLVKLNFIAQFTHSFPCNYKNCPSLQSVIQSMSTVCPSTSLAINPPLHHLPRPFNSVWSINSSTSSRWTTERIRWASFVTPPPLCTFYWTEHLYSSP